MRLLLIISLLFIKPVTAVDISTASFAGFNAYHGVTENNLRDNFSGKVVLLKLWATWCPSCVEELPSLNRLSKDMSGKDFEIIALSQDKSTVQRVSSYLKSHGYNDLEAYIDNNHQMMRMMGLRKVPQSILIGKNGNIVMISKGAKNWDKSGLRSIIVSELKK